MMRIRTLTIAIPLLLITACGGGGGGNGPAAPTKAVVKLSTSGSLASGTQIGGIEVTLTMPAGVTVKATADSINNSVMVADAGVVTISGAAAGTNATAVGTYTPSTNTLTLNLANPDGFGAGEFGTVSCDIAAGTSPAAADFSLSSFTAKDLNGAAISGLTPGFTAEIK